MCQAVPVHAFQVKFKSVRCLVIMIIHDIVLCAKVKPSRKVDELNRLEAPFWKTIPLTGLSFLTYVVSGSVEVVR